MANKLFRSGVIDFHECNPYLTTPRTSICSVLTWVKPWGSSWMVISQVTTIKNGKMTQQLPPTTQKSHLALWVFSCFLFSFRTRPPQEKKNNNKKNKYQHRNFSAFFGAVFLGLPNRQVTISGDSFTIQCHHPPADEDSKLVRHVRWEPSISNINPQKKRMPNLCVHWSLWWGKGPWKSDSKKFPARKRGP